MAGVGSPVGKIHPMSTVVPGESSGHEGKDGSRSQGSGQDLGRRGQAHAQAAVKAFEAAYGARFSQRPP
jgi:hypothetical protein